MSRLYPLTFSHPYDKTVRGFTWRKGNIYGRLCIWENGAQTADYGIDEHGYWSGSVAEMRAWARRQPTAKSMWDAA